MTLEDVVKLVRIFRDGPFFPLVCELDSYVRWNPSNASGMKASIHEELLALEEAHLPNLPNSNVLEASGSSPVKTMMGKEAMLSTRDFGEKWEACLAFIKLQRSKGKSWMGWGTIQAGKLSFGGVFSIGIIADGHSPEKLTSGRPLVIAIGPTEEIVRQAFERLSHDLSPEHELLWLVYKE